MSTDCRPRPRPRSYRRLRSVAACAAALVALAPFAARAQPSTSAAELLARPVTPGTIGLLVEHVSVPAARARLAVALVDPRPELRAAAARVIYAVGLTDLLPAIAAVLPAESGHDAAFEFVRALVVLGGPQHDAVALATAQRLPDAGLLNVVATARGAEALGLLPQIRAAGARTDLIAQFLERATAAERPRLAAMAADAIQAQDGELFQAVMQTARLAEWTVPESVLIDALMHAEGRDLAVAAAWQVLHAGALESPGADRLREAAAAFVGATEGEPTAARDLVAVELMSRSLQLPSRAGAAWQALLDKPAEVRALLGLPHNAPKLTLEERQRLWGPDSPITRLAPRPGAVASLVADAASFQTASGYPTWFMSSVLQEAGCDPGRAAGQGAGGAAAELTLRPDGRVARVNLIATGVSKPCLDAARALLMTYAPPDGPRTGRTPHLVMLPFNTDFVACQDSTFVTVPPPAVGRAGGPIEPPKKIKDVRPVYPPGAQADRISGVVVLQGVISSAGCVQSMRVTRGVDSRLDWAALGAVVGWNFTPTLLEGVPTPITLSVTVNFLLR